MLKYLTKYYKGYCIGTFFLLATNLLSAYLPHLIKIAVDKLTILYGLPSLEIQNALIKLLAVIILLAIVMAIVRAISRQVIFGIGRQIEFDLKKEIFNHLISLQPSFFTEKRTGDIISIITNDVQSLRALGGFAMLNVINTVIAFALILPLMFGINVILTWTFLGTIPVVIIFVISLSGKLKKYQARVQEELGEMSNFLEQNLSGIHIIKAYAQEEAELKRFKYYNDKLQDSYLKLIAVRSYIGPVMRVVASLGFVLLLYIGGHSIVDGSFTAGDFAAYSLYIQRLIWPVATLGWMITIVYRAQVSQKRISEILDTEPVIKDRANSIEKTSFDDCIELVKLHTKIPRGINVAIIGAIGSGKTVLAHKLMHIRELEDGEIFIDGIDIKNIKLDSLRTLINLVPQDDFLFSTTIRENIAYAADLSDDEVIKLAKMVHIHDEIVKFPNGYDSIVGERGITLSGGQRQRIAIARALAINPEILVLDDSLSSLDEESSKLVLKDILELRQGKTTIFITHNVQVAESMSMVINLNKQGKS